MEHETCPKGNDDKEEHGTDHFQAKSLFGRDYFSGKFAFQTRSVVSRPSTSCETRSRLKSDLG